MKKESKFWGKISISFVFFCLTTVSMSGRRRGQPAVLADHAQLFLLWSFKIIVLIFNVFPCFPGPLILTLN